jgi:hypothetical protein
MGGFVLGFYQYTLPSDRQYTKLQHALAAMLTEGATMPVGRVAAESICKRNSDSSKHTEYACYFGCGGHTVFQKTPAGWNQSASVGLALVRGSK